jgi:2-oxoglutarate ferredoxin oxidoreductase subunit beta
VAEVGEDALIVHDPSRPDPGLAFSLARLADNPSVPTPIGISREVQRPVFARHGSLRRTPATDVELADLLVGSDSWTVG